MTNSKHYFSNEKISASAGSGKTFALTTRFIALACAKNKQNSFDPFSIIALTFTKKAAGEFLVNILKRLANAVLSEKEAEKLADAVVEALPTLQKQRPNQKTFLEILKICAKDINKLHLSTIDSFFSTIVRQNASALKIFAPVSVGDSANTQAQQFTHECISQMMRNNVISGNDVRTFAELIKRASFGKEQKRYRQAIKQTLEITHAVYLQNKDLSLWGNIAEANINYKHLPYDEKLYTKLFEQVKNQLQNQPPFEKLLDFLSDPTALTLSLPQSSILDNILQAKCDDSLKTINSISYKKSELPLQCATEIDTLLDMIFTEHLQRLSQASKAVGKIASLYENQYEQHVRAKGNITFTDMPFVLSDPERSTEKELIEYKLDTIFNHWLFDEFQDTSMIQWSVLQNLVEEAILSEEKSFYYVGDIKQSIYSWRGATPALFNGIFNYYNQNTELILNAKPLTTSWRSGEHVIEAVNRIFGDKNMLKRVFDEFPAFTFSKEFKAHVSAETLKLKKVQLPSYAQLQLYDGAKGTLDDTKEICKHILKIIEQTQPIKRGISCAILVSKNDQTNYIVEFLKKNGYNAEGELAVQISKNRPIVSLFTSILRRIAHPLNTISDAYCKMAHINDFTNDFSDEFVESATLKIYTQGFKAFFDDYEKFMREKFSHLENSVEFKWLSDVCLMLDKKAISSIDYAVEEINTNQVSTSTSKNVIQVMTIHKSKGLAFGMVIMPAKIESMPRAGMLEIGNSIMLQPNKALASMNQTLSEAMKNFNNVDKFETICKQYVAATRPERALYIIAPKFNEKNFTKDTENHIPFSRLLLEAFEPNFKECTTPKDAKKLYNDILDMGGTLDIGDANWFEYVDKNINVSQYRLPSILTQTTLTEEFETYSPSSTNANHSKPTKNTTTGTDVHAFLEKITSLKNIDYSKLKEQFNADENIAQGLCKLLKNPDFTKFFDIENALMQNEISYARIDNNKQIVGTIDRLVGIRGSSGFERAFVVDYKPTTNDIEKYKAQLMQYKIAVADILNITQEKISCYIAGYLDGNVIEI